MPEYCCCVIFGNPMVDISNTYRTSCESCAAGVIHLHAAHHGAVRLIAAGAAGSADTRYGPEHTRSMFIPRHKPTP